jgi:AcrR family transcriptional regulator
MATPEPLIRPPLQRRSRESLERVLDAGFKVLQERGLDGFTLQEVSERSGVSIGSIYARVPGKEALIMAIYERATAWAEEEDDGLRAIAEEDLAPRERIEAIVAYLANDLLAHRHILQVFMGEAPRTAYWSHRGSEKSQQTAVRFTRAVLELREHLGHPEPELAVDVAYRIVYSTIARRITHGPKFESARQVSDKKLVRELARAVADYLL